MTSGYADLIIEATGCTHDEAPYIEEFMRLEYHTLSHLDRDVFFREARISHAAYKIARANGDPLPALLDSQIGGAS